MMTNTRAKMCYYDQHMILNDRAEFKHDTIIFNTVLAFFVQVAVAVLF
jgi:hypothetical protein